MNMVERVARAIMNAYGADFFEDGSIPLSSIEAARAAIEAMMEGITPKMIDAMEEMYMPFGEMRAAWDGAFIAALNESQEGE